MKHIHVVGPQGRASALTVEQLFQHLVYSCAFPVEFSASCTPTSATSAPDLPRNAMENISADNPENDVAPYPMFNWTFAEVETALREDVRGSLDHADSYFDVVLCTDPEAYRYVVGHLTLNWADIRVVVTDAKRETHIAAACAVVCIIHDAATPPAKSLALNAQLIQTLCHGTRAAVDECWFDHLDTAVSQFSRLRGFDILCSIF
jgi:hypothetical protein